MSTTLLRHFHCREPDPLPPRRHSREHHRLSPPVPANPLLSSARLFSARCLLRCTQLFLYLVLCHLSSPYVLVLDGWLHWRKPGRPYGQGWSSLLQGVRGECRTSGAGALCTAGPEPLVGRSSWIRWSGRGRQFLLREKRTHARAVVDGRINAMVDWGGAVYDVEEEVWKSVETELDICGERERTCVLNRVLCCYDYLERLEV
ncbi:uncharacterized protein J3R85_006890 [Psidium guajava]|nr:uncharacterized protein J3R85_006890 [Psidium guajava]